jgi:hypothetical protein
MSVKIYTEEDKQITYYLRQEKKANGFVFRDYIARLDDMTPVDSFTLFLSNGEWVAWTFDTFSTKLAEARRAFAERINAQA